MRENLDLERLTTPQLPLYHPHHPKMYLTRFSCIASKSLPEAVEEHLQDAPDMTKFGFLPNSWFLYQIQGVYTKFKVFL